tara:strand:- start:384 stop:746 length:363 start_codon:yes stop_codon:yes gene_type:complete
MDKVFIGTDIVEIRRIDAILNKNSIRFLNRIYTKNEQSYCNSNANPSMHFAGRFAAKEAVKKALLSSGFLESIPLISIEISREINGEPIVNTKLRDGWRCKVSISHTKDYAVAFSIYHLG